MAIIDRSPITTRHKLVFGAIAVVGAIARAVIAVRGETVNGLVCHRGHLHLRHRVPVPTPG